MTPMTLVDRYQQALLDLNADDLADLYAPAAVHELPFMFPGMPARYNGREEIRAAYRAAWAASPARPQEIREVARHTTADDDVVVVEQVVTGILTTTAEPFEFPGVLVFRLRNGEIARVRDYMDGLAIAHATGRLPGI